MDTMTASGEIAKGILIFCCGYYLLMAIGQAVSGQTVIVAFMLVGFLIPLSIVIHGYVRDKRTGKLDKTARKQP
jgi:hypothetical protein